MPKANPATIDLDAVRAARVEKLGPPKTLRFDGNTYTLPKELPAAYAFAWAEKRFPDALAILFGEDTAAKFGSWASVDDFWKLDELITQAYGLGSLGESEASGDS